MTYIYLNYDEMKMVVASLLAFANGAEDAKSGVEANNTVNGSAADLSAMSTLPDKSQELRDKAAEIDARVELAKTQNENGITSKASDGTIAYKLPDGVEDTVANVQGAKSATQDAIDLKKALENQDAAAASEVRSRIEEHQDDQAYATSFIDTIGMKSFLELGINAQTLYTETNAFGPDSARRVPKSEEDGKAFDDLIGSLGHIFAAASQPNPKTGKVNDYSDAVHQVVVTEENWGLATVVNAFMSQSDVVYGTDFTVHLAERMETVEYNGASTDDPLLFGYGPCLDGYSLDPLAGPLFAMGNNPEAADRYFTPNNTGTNPALEILDTDGDGEADSTKEVFDPYDPSKSFTTIDGRTITPQERMKKLLDRKWNRENDKALTAAFAGESANRTSDNPNLDYRASWASGEGLTYFGKHDYSHSSNQTKRNLGVFTGNYAADLVGIGDNYNGNDATAGADTRYDYKTENGSEWHSAKEREGSLKSIIEDISDNDDAISATGQGIMKYTEKAADAEAKHDSAREEDGGIKGGQSGMYEAYTSGKSATKWVDDVADQANKDSDSDGKKNRAAMGASLSALGLVPHPAATVVSTVGSAGLTLAGAYSNDKAAETGVSPSDYNASIVRVGVRNGLVNTSQLPTDQSWYDPSTGEVTINDSTQREQFGSWWVDHGDDIGLSDQLRNFSKPH